MTKLRKPLRGPKGLLETLAGVEGKPRAKKVPEKPGRRWEYIRLLFDWGDLTELNNLSAGGWRVAGVTRANKYKSYALLEREIKETK